MVSIRLFPCEGIKLSHAKKCPHDKVSYRTLNINHKTKLGLSVDEAKRLNNLLGKYKTDFFYCEEHDKFYTFMGEEYYLKEVWSNDLRGLFNLKTHEWLDEVEPECGDAY